MCVFILQNILFVLCFVFSVFDLLFFFCFFFFKQKPAYEMRISDWSSDVCSSDLHTRGWNGPTRRMCAFCAQLAAIAFSAAKLSRSATPPSTTTTERAGTDARKRIAPAPRQTSVRMISPGTTGAVKRKRIPVRSEEHTSELQSLMRNSYAVL